MAELTFEPPGPGRWLLDTTHFSGPVSRYYREICPEAQLNGFRRGAEHYGYLYDRVIEFVNGFWYSRWQRIAGPSDASPRTEAKLQRRMDRLAETYETKRWREDIKRWDDDWKPAHRDVNLSLQAVDPAALDDGELLDHLENCRQALIDGEVLHHRMSLCWGIPQYDFLHYTSKWTSRSPHELLSLLDGASPDSAGAVEELQRVVETIRDTPSARQVLRSDADPATIIDRLWEIGGTVESAVNDWLGVVGYRLISGWDLAEPYALEHPETLVRTLRTALDDRSDGPVDHDPSDQLASVRREVPEEHRDEFDEFYEEARLTYRIRDERNFLSGPSRGLLRRALLEVGRRLGERDRLCASDHVVDFTPDELVAVFNGAGTPTAAEVAARVEHRRSHDNADAPDHLGADTTDPFDDWDLPDPARRLVSGVQAYQQANDLDSTASSAESTTVRGLGASSGTAEGPARVVSDPADFPDIRDGDVLVTEMMSPGYNVILPIIDGIVTNTGGKLSHPAIVAREYGLPAVVGCEDATDHIDDGDRIAIDGDAGTVQLL